MKTTNSTNYIGSDAQERLKNIILASAKESEPSAEQIAREQKESEESMKKGGARRVFLHNTWNGYKKLMDNLGISDEYYTWNVSSVIDIDIVESIFPLAEHEEKFLFGFHRSQRKYYNEDIGIYLDQENFYDECIRLITDAGLISEYNAWLAERQVHDRNGQVIRVGDIIRFPEITEVCGRPVENGYEASVTVTNNGLVWIGYPENASFAYNGEQSEHLHIPGVPLTAELAACAEVVIKREEGFVRHPHHGDFILPRIHEPASEKPQIFVKKS
jgi:hypothetical protein